MSVAAPTIKQDIILDVKGLSKAKAAAQAMGQLAVAIRSFKKAQKGLTALLSGQAAAMKANAAATAEMMANLAGLTATQRANLAALSKHLRAQAMLIQAKANLKRAIAQEMKQRHLAAAALNRQRRAMKKMEKQKKANRRAAHALAGSLGALTGSVRNMGFNMFYHARSGGLFALLAALTALRVLWSGMMMPAARYDQQMSMVRKTTKMTAEETDALAEKFLVLSSRLGIARDKLAEIATVAGQLGIRGEKNLLAFTETVAMMVQVSEIAPDKAAAGISKLAVAFELPISEAEALGSALNELGNNTVAKVPELIQALNKIGTTGKQIGLTFAEVAGMVATLMETGVVAPRAGTTLRNIFIIMQSKAEEISRMMGMTVQNYFHALKTNTFATMEEFLDRLKKADAATQAIFISDRGSGFGKQNFSQLQSLAELDELRMELIQLANREYEKRNSLEEEYARKIDNTMFKWERLKKIMGNWLTGEGSKINVWFEKFLDDQLRSVYSMSMLVKQMDKLYENMENRGTSWVDKLNPANWGIDPSALVDPRRGGLLYSQVNRNRKNLQETLEAMAEQASEGQDYNDVLRVREYLMYQINKEGFKVVGLTKEQALAQKRMLPEIQKLVEYWFDLGEYAEKLADTLPVIIQRIQTAKSNMLALYDGFKEEDDGTITPPATMTPAEQVVYNAYLADVARQQEKIKELKERKAVLVEEISGYDAVLIQEGLEFMIGRTEITQRGTKAVEDHLSFLNEYVARQKELREVLAQQEEFQPAAEDGEEEEIDVKRFRQARERVQNMFLELDALSEGNRTIEGLLRERKKLVNMKNTLDEEMHWLSPEDADMSEEAAGERRMLQMLIDYQKRRAAQVEKELQMLYRYRTALTNAYDDIFEAFNDIKNRWVDALDFSQFPLFDEHGNYLIENAKAMNQAVREIWALRRENDVDFSDPEWVAKGIQEIEDMIEKAWESGKVVDSPHILDVFQAYLDRYKELREELDPAAMGRWFEQVRSIVNENIESGMISDGSKQALQSELDRMSVLFSDLTSPNIPEEKRQEKLREIADTAEKMIDAVKTAFAKAGAELPAVFWDPFTQWVKSDRKASEQAMQDVREDVRESTQDVAEPIKIDVDTDEAKKKLQALKDMLKSLLQIVEDLADIGDVFFGLSQEANLFIDGLSKMVDRVWKLKEAFAEMEAAAAALEAASEAAENVQEAAQAASNAATAAAAGSVIGVISAVVQMGGAIVSAIRNSRERAAIQREEQIRVAKENAKSMEQVMKNLLGPRVAADLSSNQRNQLLPQMEGFFDFMKRYELGGRYSWEVMGQIYTWMTEGGKTPKAVKESDEWKDMIAMLVKMGVLDEDDEPSWKQLQKIYESVLFQHGQFANTFEGLMASIQFLTKFLDLDVAEAFKRFIERMKEVGDVPDWIQRQLGTLDLSKEEDRQQLETWIKSWAQLSASDPTFNTGGMSRDEFEEFLDYLLSLAQGDPTGGQESDVSTLSVTRSITDVQANAVILLLEQTVYWLKSIATHVGVTGEFPGGKIANTPNVATPGNGQINKKPPMSNWEVDVNGDINVQVPFNPDDARFADAVGQAVASKIRRYGVRR